MGELWLFCVPMALLSAIGLVALATAIVCRHQVNARLTRLALRARARPDLP